MYPNVFREKRNLYIYTILYNFRFTRITNVDLILKNLFSQSVILKCENTIRSLS